MNGVQTIVLSLLKELDELFESKGINYCVSDKLAWDCWLHARFTGGYFETCLLVSAQEFEMLSSLELPANRLWARYDINDVVWLNYVATDTTLLSVDAVWQDRPGVFVEICPVLREGKGFRVCTRAKSILLPFDPLDSSDKAVFETIKLSLPARPAEYLECLQGESWQDGYDLPAEVLRFGTVFRPSVPYEKYIEKVQAEGRYDRSLAQTATELEKFRKNELKEAEDQVKQLTSQFRFITQRYRLCEKYLPHKQRLIESWEKGEKDNVAAALEPYVRRIKSFYFSQGKALYFDRDLFKLAMKVLAHQRWKRVVLLPFKISSKHRRQELSKVMEPYFKGKA